MANPNKAKGTKWETDVVRYLRDQGIPARRNAQHGLKDIGDIWFPDFTIEAKDHAKIDLASFVDQSTRESDSAGTSFGVAVVKRRNKNVKHGYAVMDLETFTRLAKLTQR